MAMILSSVDIGETFDTLRSLALLIGPLALGLTLIFEVPIAAVMGLRSRREVAAVVGVNLITSPVLVWVLSVLGPGRVVIGSGWSPPIFWAAFAALEVTVAVVEWRLLTWALHKPSRRMLAVSIVMNLAVELPAEA